VVISLSEAMSIAAFTKGPVLSVTGRHSRRDDLGDFGQIQSHCGVLLRGRNDAGAAAAGRAVAKSPSRPVDDAGRAEQVDPITQGKASSQ
jgi:hypothetical protein